MKMKKFINAPETITDEELTGLGLAYPDILDVDGHLVISKDLASADRVTIVTYGGSGHEPAQAGFVGKGMLDVQAVGDIFAAPNGQLVFDAMKLADKGHGVLLLTLNYAGDQLAGKQAMKLAQKAGLNVRQVVTGEEIQYDPNGEDNKRGLAGAVALYHIAAAAARQIYFSTAQSPCFLHHTGHYGQSVCFLTIFAARRAILPPSAASAAPISLTLFSAYMTSNSMLSSGYFICDPYRVAAYAASRLPTDDVSNLCTCDDSSFRTIAGSCPREYAVYASGPDAVRLHHAAAASLQSADSWASASRSTR